MNRVDSASSLPVTLPARYLDRHRILTGTSSWPVPALRSHFILNGTLLWPAPYLSMHFIFNCILSWPAPHLDQHLLLIGIESGTGNILTGTLSTPAPFLDQHLLLIVWMPASVLISAPVCVPACVWYRFQFNLGSGFRLVPASFGYRLPLRCHFHFGYRLEFACLL